MTAVQSHRRNRAVFNLTMDDYLPRNLMRRLLWRSISSENRSLINNSGKLIMVNARNNFATMFYHFADLKMYRYRKHVPPDYKQRAKFKKLTYYIDIILSNFLGKQIFFVGSIVRCMYPSKSNKIFKSIVLYSKINETVIFIYLSKRYTYDKQLN